MADTYTEGVCHDGAAILRNGERMTIAEILAALNATTTPPADAALADSIDSLGFVISGDNPPVKEWVSECGGGCMPATKEEKMMWDVLQSALRARAVPDDALDLLRKVAQSDVMSDRSGVMFVHLAIDRDVIDDINAMLAASKEPRHE